MSTNRRHVVRTYNHGQFQGVLLSTGGYQVYHNDLRTPAHLTTPAGVKGVQIATFSCMDEDLVASDFPVELLRGVSELYSAPATLTAQSRAWAEEKLLKIDYSPAYTEVLAAIRRSLLSSAEQVAAITSAVAYKMKFDVSFIEGLIHNAPALDSIEHESLPWPLAYEAYLTPLIFTARTDKPLTKLYVRAFKSYDDFPFTHGVFQFLSQPNEDLTFGEFLASADPTAIRVDLPQDFALMIQERLQWINRRADLHPLTPSQMEFFFGYFMTGELGHLGRWQVQRLLDGVEPMGVKNRTAKNSTFRLAPWLLTQEEFDELDSADYSLPIYASLHQVAMASDRANANVTVLVAELGLERAAQLCYEIFDSTDYYAGSMMRRRFQKTVEAQKLLLLTQEPCRSLAPTFAITMADLHAEGETSARKARRGRR